MKLAVLLLVTCVSMVTAWPHYQANIPNGDYIPHPCKPNFVWKGVGHLNQAGGGANNQFGLDFKAANHTWTKALCQMDSDGDGFSNGAELGDPECVWTKGTVPAETTKITHPGVCDPFDSDKCKDKNKEVKCDSEKFNCPAIEEEGVFHRDVRFPYTNVPAKETSYMCMGFNLPDDGDYHLIATQPLINESRVMHHVAVIACTEESDEITEPTDCVMGLRGCTTTIGLWTLGLPGECFYKEAGVRIGLQGMKKGVLQFHWTNPEERTDLWDASGMRLHFTKNLRKYDMGSWSTGQTYLEIPPLTPKVVQHSTCSRNCTRRMLNDSIFLTTGLNHMHYLGVSEYVKLIREDGTEVMLTDDKQYSYDTPILYEYDPPIEVRPGDRLETVCTYRSMSRKKTAFFGEGTFDEMCFGIFNYYPTSSMKSPFAACVTRKDYDYCKFDEGFTCPYYNMFNFSLPYTKTIVDKVMAACSYGGECLHGCRDVVDDLMQNHECFKDGIAENVIFPAMAVLKDSEYATDMLRFIMAMRSCECNSEYSITYDPFNPISIGDSASPIFLSFFSLFVLILSMFL